MNSLYELLDSEDLFKIPKNIRQRFAKLTLSKKKQIRKSIIENTSIIPRSLNKELEGLLSDDSSESEAEAINKIFLSQSSKDSKTKNAIVDIEKDFIDMESEILLESQSSKNNEDISRNSIENLVFNDSDETYCSIHEDEKEYDVKPPKSNLEKSVEMEKLQVTENISTQPEHLFFSQTINSLSQQISKINIKSPEKNVKNEMLAKNILISTNRQKRSSCRSSGSCSYEMNNFGINNSILIISSAETTPIKKSIICDDDDDDDDDEESEVIVVDDSDEESANCYDDIVSDLRLTGQTNLCSTLSNSQADRLQTFINDLPTKNMLPQILPNKTVNQKPNESNSSVILESSEGSLPNVSIEVAETSTEHDEESCKESVPLTNQESLTIVERTPLMQNEENPNPDSSLSQKTQNNSKISSGCQNISTTNQETSTIEDNSPLIQTEENPKSESSSSDSSAYDEHIAISAKFNIKIHFSHPTIVSKSTSKESIENSPQIEVASTTKSTESENYRENQKPTTPKTDKCDESLSLEDVDLKAQKILTKLYGKQWQTPEIIKKLDRNSPANINESLKNNILVDKNVENNTMANFSMFHNNIRCDFESTRLQTGNNDNRKPLKERNKPQTERKPKIKANEFKTFTATKSRFGREIKRMKDDDLDELEEHDQCYSSDDSFDAFQKPKLPRNNTTKKPRKKDEIIYLDLSSNVIKIVDKSDYKSPVKCQEINDVNVAAEKLDNILKSCTFEGKKKMEQTPIRRMLFTPQLELDEETSIYNSPIRPKQHLINGSNLVQLNLPIPKIFALPVNKNLESAKYNSPIFRTPKNNKTEKASTGTDTPTRKDKIKENESPVNKKTPVSSARKYKKGSEIIENDKINTYGFLHSLNVIVPKTLCHPDALIYRDKFKTTKNELTEKLYNLFNDKLFENKLNVPIVWNKKLQNTAGRCSNKKRGTIRSSTIDLSEKVLTSADRLRCTLIHELCHAATWIFNEEHGHGAIWKSWAAKANMVFPELPKISICHKYDIEYKYTYKCKKCCAKSHAHSKSKKVENIRCFYCHGAIEILINKKNKDGEIISTPVKGPSGFAKFVQAKYKDFKRPNIKHADVMKMLGTEFAGLSVEEKSKF